MTRKEKVNACQTLQKEAREDCISRKAVLEYQQYLHGKMSNELNHELWKFITNLPSITSKSWNPVSEKLPKKDGEYLCTRHCCDHDFIETICFANNLHKADDYHFLGSKRPGWYNIDSEGPYEVVNVVAWMELPKPYKVESEE